MLTAADVTTASEDCPPIAVNKSKKAVGCSLFRIKDRKKMLENEKVGVVHLLPPPKELSLFKAIELLIDLIIGKKGKTVVPWRNQINVPNESALKERINQKHSVINQLQEEISQLREQVTNWDSYRDLLTETNDYLENIVQKTLLDLGFKTEKTEKSFPADLLGKEIAVEVTGIEGGVTVSSNKINQVIRFRDNYRKQEKIVLIANTYRDLPPNDRKGKMHFSQPAALHFDNYSVCYMTTATLFELWKDVISGKKKQKDVKSKILTKIGELNTREFT